MLRTFPKDRAIISEFARISSEAVRLRLRLHILLEDLRRVHRKAVCGINVLPRQYKKVSFQLPASAYDLRSRWEGKKI